MSIFRKTIGRRCMEDPECPLHGQMQDPGAVQCEESRHLTEPVEVTHWPLVIVVSLLTAAVIGGGAYAARAGALAALARVIPGLPGAGSDEHDRGNHRGDDRDAFAASFAIEFDDDGRSRLIDPELPTLRSADRFRFRVRGDDSAHVYIFYNDRAKGTMLSLAARGVSTRGGAEPELPTGDAWITLDEHTGIERFTVIAAAAPIPELEFDGEVYSDEFDRAVSRIEDDLGLTETNGDPSGDWIRIDGRGAVLAAVEIRHVN